MRSSRRVLGVGNALASEPAIMCLVSEEANVGTDRVVIPYLGTLVRVHAALWDSEG